MQTIAQRNAEILSQMVQDQSEMAREIAGEKTPEEKVARSADLARRSYEKTVNGIREVSDIVNKSGREASEIINKRVATALSEIASTMEDQPKAAKSEKSGSKKAA
jgi:phasin family protein